MPTSVRASRRRTTTTRKAIDNEGAIIVELYLRLYESEGWPPAGPIALTPAHAAARRRLRHLAQLGMRIERWLATDDATNEIIRMQFRDEDALDVTDAVRLAVCQQRLAATTSYRVPKKHKSAS